MGLVVQILIALSVYSVSCFALDLDPSHQIFHFHGTDTTSRIGSSLKGLGDINNDGYDDIAFNSHSPKGTYIFLGGNPIDNIPDYFLKGTGRIGDYLDYNGDAIPDLITVQDQVIYFYAGHDGFIEEEPSDSIVGPITVEYFGVYLATGNLDNDDITDIIVFANEFGVGHKAILYLNPFSSDKLADWEYTYVNNSHQIMAVGVIDFNGDLTNDMFVSIAPGQDSFGYVHIFLGPTFSSAPDIVIAHPVDLEGEANPEYFAFGAYNVSDINGDGWEDLGVRYNTIPLIYCGGPDADTLYDYRLQGTCIYMSQGGDLNGDSYIDLITGGSETMNGRVVIYLGGPYFDNTRDDQIDRDDLPPLFLDHIGWIVASAGDFDGDDIDDILFSCQNFAYGEPRDVFVFNGGNDIIVDINDGNHTIYPNDFTLFQNYPNPFNASTIIEFAIPKKVFVTLCIYNLLGQEVKTMINTVLPANNYKAEWKGETNDGDIAPSGIYIYKLTTQDKSLSKKMMFMK